MVMTVVLPVPERPRMKTLLGYLEPEIWKNHAVVKDAWSTPVSEASRTMFYRGSVNPDKGEKPSKRGAATS